MRIATLDHHEGAAATDPLPIGLDLVIGDAEVYQRLRQVCFLIGGVPPARGGVGHAAPGVIQRKMDVMACIAIVDELLHHLLSIDVRVI